MHELLAEVPLLAPFQLQAIVPLLSVQAVRKEVVVIPGYEGPGFYRVHWKDPERGSSLAAVGNRRGAEGNWVVRIDCVSGGLSNVECEVGRLERVYVTDQPQAWKTIRMIREKTLSKYVEFWLDAPVTQPHRAADRTCKWEHLHKMDGYDELVQVTLNAGYVGLEINWPDDSDRPLAIRRSVDDLNRLGADKPWERGAS